MNLKQYFINLLRNKKNIYKMSLKIYSFINKSKVVFSDEKIIISQKNQKEIILHIRNITYVKEIVDYFNFYYDSVLLRNNTDSLDFSTPKEHELANVSFSFGLEFSSVPTPAQTSSRYIEILKPKPGDTILDLGSYCGLTVIDFLLSVGNKGFVLGVEADSNNFMCLKNNMEKFRKEYAGYNFELENVAISDKVGFEYFSNNQDMSSAIVDISPTLHQQKNNYTKVPSSTVSELCKKHNLKKIDIIKADIEGSEVNLLKDATFFENHNPKILLEPISLKGKNSLEEIYSYMDHYGYEVKTYNQEGAKVPIYLFERNLK